MEDLVERHFVEIVDISSRKLIRCVGPFTPREASAYQVSVLSRVKANENDAVIVRHTEDCALLDMDAEPIACDCGARSQANVRAP